MTATGMAMAAFLITLGVILGLTVPGYLRLFRLLAADHPATYERLGKPTLLNRSVRKSFRVQRFVYSGYKTVGASDELARLCRNLGLWTPILIGVLFAEFGWFTLAVLRLLEG